MGIIALCLQELFCSILHSKNSHIILSKIDVMYCFYYTQKSGYFGRLFFSNHSMIKPCTPLFVNLHSYHYFAKNILCAKCR